jgi:hypothetical protein
MQILEANKITVYLLPDNLQIGVTIRLPAEAERK